MNQENSAQNSSLPAVATSVYLTGSVHGVTSSRPSVVSAVVARNDTQCVLQRRLESIDEPYPAESISWNETPAAENQNVRNPTFAVEGTSSRADFEVQDPGICWDAQQELQHSASLA